MRHPSSLWILLAVVLSPSVVLWPSAASAQPSVTLDSLLGQFAALPGLEARFVEEKRIALLAVPVRSEGRLFFVNPGRMMRHVTSPDPSHTLIADGELRMRSGGRTETLSIRTNPVLRGFVESFRAVLAGNRADLDRFYVAQLTTSADGWELRLTPRDAALREFLRSITMRGQGVILRDMRMVEVSGDETRTEFFDVDTHRSFSPAEAQRIFCIPTGS